MYRANIVNSGGSLANFRFATDWSTGMESSLHFSQISKFKVLIFCVPVHLF